jgi:flagellar biosynthesis anti-sigma factor FlgM
MRRTWNSWTYYDSECGPERSAPNENGVGDADGGRNVFQENVQCEEPHRKGGATREPGGDDPKIAMSDAIKREMDVAEVRMERVERVKEALREGRYEVSSQELARKLMNNMQGIYR